MAAPSVDKGSQSNPPELPEPLNKAKPFECLPRTRGSPEGRHESHLDEQKECFQSPPAVPRKFRNLIPHILALQQVREYTKNFLEEKARAFESGSDADSDDDTEEDEEEDHARQQHVFMGIAMEVISNEEKFKMMHFLEHRSFILDVMLFVLYKQERPAEQDVQVVTEFKNFIADAQVLIGELKKLAQIENGDTTTEDKIARLWSSLDDALDNVEGMETKANFEKEHMQPYLTDASRVSHALGLEIDFLHRSGFDQLPQHCADHMSIKEWICNFLEENYKQEKQLPDSASLSDEELLQRIGFRADAVNTVLQRPSTLKEHLHIFDWAEMYLRDEFKYNPVLSGCISPKFPNLARNLSCREVNVIHLDSKPNSMPYPKQDGCSSFPQDLEDETHKVLFHGTDHDSALDIFIHGTRITHGRRNRDFSSGSGFYLTDDFEHSVEWAFCSTCKPVVLVYRVDKRLLKPFSGYSLVGEDKRNEWTDLVKQYRSGKPTKKLRKSVRAYGYIEGPRASSCDAASPEPKDGTYQMCVISEELAEALDDSALHSAVFYDV